MNSSKEVAFLCIIFLTIFVILVCLLFSSNSLIRKYFPISLNMISVVFFLFLVLFYSAVPTYDDNDVENGALWSKCQLIEENFYGDKIKKLNCDGVIMNIPSTLYSKSVYAYTQEGMRKRE